ncbi:MAG: aminodeoxychorismate synthase component I [Proteobacteria bacterium]|nr:aminodeoxychorismate synthase component I [Pseudomonadota bacterium]
MESALPPFAFFDNNLDADGGAWLLTGLIEEVVCDHPDNWQACLRRLDEAIRNDAWVAVAAAYELGYAIEPRLRPLLPAGNSPLLQAWIFERGDWLDAAASEAWLTAQAGDASCGVGALQANISETVYLEHIERIRHYIANGDCYQVNYTFPFSGQAYGAPAALYQALRTAQPVRYGAFIRHAGGSILSRSPELFLERRGTTLSSLPMKGTAPRHADPTTLSTSEKDRAENVMIVDLIRNDMGRLAPAGGVRVDELFQVEPYPTVWQMISRVVAEPVTARLAEIFRALFPCGSITGAPKIRAMEIIRELEASPRGVYCGALGFIRPGGDFRLSVPIRTLLLDTDGQAKLNVGSGVVYDSSPAGEWAECHLKARFLTALPTPLRLIETLRYAPSEEKAFSFLPEHLERLADSARWFGFPFDAGAFRRTLSSVNGDTPLRVRITLGQQGDLRVETAPLSAGAPAETPTVVLSPHRIRSDDPLLRHKTTARRLYDQELARVMGEGHFDALFLNERGELAEGARSNLFVQKNGELLTPPQKAGLLNGVLRRRLLRKGRAREARLTVEDLHQAEALFVGNGLRGLIRVQFAPCACGLDHPAGD